MKRAAPAMPSSPASDALALKETIERLQVENAELRAAVDLLTADVKTLGADNVRLVKAYSAALAEVHRLNGVIERGATKGSRGRPKAMLDTYEEMLVRETIEEITRSLHPGKKRLSERAAAMKADRRIRATAKNLQGAGMPGAFVSLAADYPADEASVLTAWRRAKRKAGIKLPSRTNN